MAGNLEPTVLFRDDSFLALDKPSGMLVHRGWGNDKVVLVDLAKDFLGQSTVHPIHRIDRGTSGVVLFALTPEIAAQMQAGFEDGRVEKRYLVLVRGRAPESGVIDHPVPRKEKGPKVDARTHFRRLAVAETEPRKVSWLEAIPKTGRLHQIRRHLKHIHHPVIGDANYGKGALNREVAERYGLRRLALHAAGLAFEHPVSIGPVAIEAPIPASLYEPLSKMGIDYNR